MHEFILNQKKKSISITSVSIFLPKDWKNTKRFGDWHWPSSWNKLVFAIMKVHCGSVSFRFYHHIRHEPPTIFQRHANMKFSTNTFRFSTKHKSYDIKKLFSQTSLHHFRCRAIKTIFQENTNQIRMKWFIVFCETTPLKALF